MRASRLVRLGARLYLRYSEVSHCGRLSTLLATAEIIRLIIATCCKQLIDFSLSNRIEME